MGEEKRQIGNPAKINIAKLGTTKKPIIMRVQSEERARQVAEICAEHEWIYIIGFDPDKPKDISDCQKVEKLKNTALKERNNSIFVCFSHY